jgi:hypothetical protein
VGFDDCVVVDVGNQPDFIRPCVVVRIGIVCDADLQSVFGHQAPQINDGQVIDRLFRNPKTTIIGLLVMVVSFVFVWFGKASLTEVGVFITGGFAMLFLKDPKDDGGKN